MALLIFVTAPVLLAALGAGLAGYVMGWEGCLVAHQKRLRTANEELEKISLSLGQSSDLRAKSFMVIMTNRSLG